MFILCCLMTLFLIIEAKTANSDFYKTRSGAALQQTFNEFSSSKPNGLQKFLRCPLMNEFTKKESKNGRKNDRNNRM